MDLKERIKELCKEKEISLNKLESDCGVAKGYISKLDKSSPSVATIQRIAEYLDVSIDYLLTEIALNIISTRKQEKPRKSFSTLIALCSVRHVVLNRKV